MTPPARMQAAIELLDGILAATRAGGAAADTLIQRYFKERRYAGAKDRRAVRELVYRAIRRSSAPPPSGRAAMLGLAIEEPALLALFDGSPHGPALPEAEEARAEAGVAPQWMTPLFDPLIGSAELPALLGRAPLDLRVNRLKGNRDSALGLFAGAVPTPLSPVGLRLFEPLQVEASEHWQAGLVEVQDEGSQLIAQACGVEPDMAIVDLCAGAGGKTLALAADMGNRGRILACDTDRARLSRLVPRADRAGVDIVETMLLNPGSEIEALKDWRGVADVILVDAPCSGSGTWRRNPETRWRLNADRLRRLVQLQGQLLDIAAELLRPGGHLTYAVCSLLAEEGRGQADSFGAPRSAFVSVDVPIDGGRPSGPGRLLTPAHDGTDGFFIARWQAPC